MVWERAPWYHGARRPWCVSVCEPGASLTVVWHWLCQTLAEWSQGRWHTNGKFWSIFPAARFLSCHWCKTVSSSPVCRTRPWKMPSPHPTAPATTWWASPATAISLGHAYRFYVELHPVNPAASQTQPDVSSSCLYSSRGPGRSFRLKLGAALLLSQQPNVWGGTHSHWRKCFHALPGCAPKPHSFSHHDIGIVWSKAHTVIPWYIVPRQLTVNDFENILTCGILFQRESRWFFTSPLSNAHVITIGKGLSDPCLSLDPSVLRENGEVLMCAMRGSCLSAARVSMMCEVLVLPDE